MIIAITAMLSLILGLLIAGVIGIALATSALLDLKAYTMTQISLLQDIENHQEQKHWDTDISGGGID